jgi:hypothetical protein
MTSENQGGSSDSTVLVTPIGSSSPSKSPAVRISYPTLGGERTEHLTSNFLIGRGRHCQIRIDDGSVSRQHLEVCWQAGQWWVRDLQSSNGTYLNGQPFERAALKGVMTLELGNDGPVIHLEGPPGAKSAASEKPASADDIARRYLDPSYSGPVGEHTKMVRHAIQSKARKQSRRYWGIIGVVMVLLLGAGGFAGYQYFKLQKASELAVDIFYNMKTLELQIANMEAELEDTTKSAQLASIAVRKQQLADLEKKYQAFVSKIGPFSGTAIGRALINDEDMLILHMARVFGECELNVPEGFADEVKRYITHWKSTPRLRNAIQRLQENNYAPIIARELMANQLPPQFLYLALQESGFRARAVGPRTRYGHAKGMWQFIPSTGERYGLRSGPLRELGEYDPQDERHHFEKATAAAAKYLSYIYRTDAQASGLLVMASYNWGEGNIIKRIRQMPKNPKERNFWQLLQRYKIPKETYDYVFYIFSAAVIGENPKLFGFDFESPLGGYPATSTTTAAGSESTL